MAALKLGDILVSQAANDLASDDNIKAVVRQLIEHAELDELPPGNLYLTEFRLGPNEFTRVSVMIL